MSTDEPELDTPDDMQQTVGRKRGSRRGGGRPTIADVAKLAGVGAITVSRALREPQRVSRELRQQIDAAISTLGYVPDPNARALASAAFRLATPIAGNNIAARMAMMAITTSSSMSVKARGRHLTGEVFIKSGSKARDAQTVGSVMICTGQYTRR